MSQKTALGAVAFLFDRSGGARDLTVNFFGGKPLLNDAVVEATAAACRERAAWEQKRVTFALTTNGTLLDERRLDMLWRHGIRPLISIDGPQAAHDGARPFPDGAGSYRAVAAGARRALARDPHLMARATMSGGCKSYIDIAESLLGLGFKRLHMTAASPVNPGFGLGDADFDGLHAQFTAFCDWFLDGVVAGRFADCFFGPLDHIIGDLYRRRAGVYACSAGLTGLYVAPNGDLFPCFRAVRDHYYLGNVLRGEFDGHRRQPFYAAASDRRPACAACWASTSAAASASATTSTRTATC